MESEDRLRNLYIELVNSTDHDQLDREWRIAMQYYGLRRAPWWRRLWYRLTGR